MKTIKVQFLYKLYMTGILIMLNFNVWFEILLSPVECLNWEHLLSFSLLRLSQYFYFCHYRKTLQKDLGLFKKFGRESIFCSIFLYKGLSDLSILLQRTEYLSPGEVLPIALPCLHISGNSLGNNTIFVIMYGQVLHYVCKGY